MRRDSLDGRIRGDAEMRVELLDRAARAEAGHADEDAVGADEAVPALPDARLDGDPDGSITGVDRIDGVITGETNQYYRDFARAMRDIGYAGYISYELCHQLPLVNGQTVGIEFAHKNAQLAAEFMREIIRSESGKKSEKTHMPQPVGAA